MHREYLIEFADDGQPHSAKLTHKSTGTRLPIQEVRIELKRDLAAEIWVRIREVEIQTKQS